MEDQIPQAVSLKMVKSFLRTAAPDDRIIFGSTGRILPDVRRFIQDMLNREQIIVCQRRVSKGVKDVGVFSFIAIKTKRKYKDEE
jgi:hypothetical protein